MKLIGSPFIRKEHFGSETTEELTTEQKENKTKAEKPFLINHFFCFKEPSVGLEDEVTVLGILKVLSIVGFLVFGVGCLKNYISTSTAAVKGAVVGAVVTVICLIVILILYSPLVGWCGENHYIDKDNYIYILRDDEYKKIKGTFTKDTDSGKINLKYDSGAEYTANISDVQEALIFNQVNIYGAIPIQFTSTTANSRNIFFYLTGGKTAAAAAAARDETEGTEIRDAYSKKAAEAAAVTK